MPDFQDYAVAVPKPADVEAEATRVTAKFLRDVMKLNLLPIASVIYLRRLVAPGRLRVFPKTTTFLLTVE